MVDRDPQLSCVNQGRNIDAEIGNEHGLRRLLRGFSNMTSGILSGEGIYARAVGVEIHHSREVFSGVNLN